MSKTLAQSVTTHSIRLQTGCWPWTDLSARIGMPSGHGGIVWPELGLPTTITTPSNTATPDTTIIRTITVPGTAALEGTPQHPRRESRLWRRHAPDIPSHQLPAGPDHAALWAALLAGTQVWWNGLPVDQQHEFEDVIHQAQADGEPVTIEAVAVWMMGHPPQPTEVEREEWQTLVVAVHGVI
jgi:hypothetical protein